MWKKEKQESFFRQVKARLLYLGSYLDYAMIRMYSSQGIRSTRLFEAEDSSNTQANKQLRD